MRERVLALCGSDNVGTMERVVVICRWTTRERTGPAKEARKRVDVFMLDKREC